MTKGERIKLLREKANMTQEELAKLLNTTKQTIYKYEQIQHILWDGSLINPKQVKK